MIDVAAASRRCFEVERRLLRTRLRPPPELTVAEWADAYRVLSRESSAEPGRWNTERAPYLRGIMDAFSEPGVQMVVGMIAAQTGKTEVILNVLGYHMDQDPAPCLVLLPTVELGHAFSKDRLAPMLRDSPRLAGLVSPVKSRDPGNTILHKKFPGGHVTIAGSNSPASLASRPIRVVVADEVDRYPVSSGSEGDPLALAEKRTATFWNRKIGKFSTPTVKGFSRIEEAYLEGDRRRFWVPCPACKGWQTLAWRNLHWDNNDAATARYACEHCGALLDESEKPAMLLAGEWRPEEPTRAIASFHLSALYSPWTTWEEMVQEFLLAKGNPERLRVWVNTGLAETWEESGDAIEPEGLLIRREKYEAQVPAGGAILTAAVDVQGDRLEVKVKAWGAGEESWLVRTEQLWGDPAQELVWNNLEEILFATYYHASGAALAIAATTVDSGGHHTEAVYRFVRKHRRRRVFAIKGMAGAGRPLVGRPSKANKWGVKLLPVGVDTAKDMIFARLRITRPGPGYLHFPEWADPEYFAQLTAEKVVTRFVRGRPVRSYEKTRPRNEALDLEVYSLVALVTLGPSVVNHLATFVERLSRDPKAKELDGAHDDSVAEDEPIPKTTHAVRRLKPKGKGFASRW